LSFAADGLLSYAAVAIPDFQTLMRPLLEAYSANDEGPISDVRRELATQFHLSDEELAERLPSGLARTFDNRVGWAATYLYRTGLLTRPRPAVYQTHQRGRDVLQANPERVDLSVLAHFPEFEEFRRGLDAGDDRLSSSLQLTKPRRPRNGSTPLIRSYVRSWLQRSWNASTPCRLRRLRIWYSTCFMQWAMATEQRTLA